MSGEVDVAQLVVREHEHLAHEALEARIAELMGLIESACAEAAELRAQIADHQATYHAPEPEEEPPAEEPPAEEPPAETPPAETPPPADEPAPAGDEQPRANSFLFRRLHTSED